MKLFFFFYKQLWLLFRSSGNGESTTLLMTKIRVKFDKNLNIKIHRTTKAHKPCLTNRQNNQYTPHASSLARTRLKLCVSCVPSVCGTQLRRVAKSAGHLRRNPSGEVVGKYQRSEMLPPLSSSPIPIPIPMTFSLASFFVWGQKRITQRDQRHFTLSSTL